MQVAPQWNSTQATYACEYSREAAATTLSAICTPVLTIFFYAEEGDMNTGDLAIKWEGLRTRHKHDHAAVLDINREHDRSLTVGQRIADRVAEIMGSWPFIIIQSLVLGAWIMLNVIAYIRHWDPYPFILLNLALSFQAAYAAPIIMMSQNRQADKDRLMAQHDYQINLKAEQEVKAIMHHLEQQDDIMIDILHRLEAQHRALLERGAITTGH
jgi:uncharacterized membrane protein